MVSFHPRCTRKPYPVFSQVDVINMGTQGNPEGDSYSESTLVAEMYMFVHMDRRVIVHPYSYLILPICTV